MAPVFDHRTLRCSLIPHSVIEFPEADQIVPWCNGGDEIIQLSIGSQVHLSQRLERRLRWSCTGMRKNIKRSLMVLGRKLWACTRDVLSAKKKKTPYSQRFGAGFPFQKMDCLDSTSSILPSSNILVPPRATTSMLKRTRSLQTWAVLFSDFAPSWTSRNILTFYAPRVRVE